jgi:hypothetical protein
MKDLTTRIENVNMSIDNLIEKSNKFMQIATRAADPNSKHLMEFKSLTPDKIDKIANNMPEINRATMSLGKSGTQVTSKLMTIHMLAQGPYRRMRQCLAQIEKKRQAVKENVFKLNKEKVKLKKLLYDRDILVESDDPLDGFKLEEIEIDINEKLANISDSALYIEAALKEIGVYQEVYNEIKESNDIPENWDELNMEEAEVEENIKAAFLNAIRDTISHGRINAGTHEYLEQFGINPIAASALVNKYVNETTQNINEDKVPDINSLYDFLDQMAYIFKDEWKKAMSRLGIKNLISKDFLYIEKSKI